MLRMLDGNDSYETFHKHAHLPGPQPSSFADPATQQEEADAFALKFAVTAVDMTHYIEDSNPDHKSWMFHITWAVMPEFAAKLRTWQHCTGKLEARGAAAKRVGRTTVCWRKQTRTADRSTAPPRTRPTQPHWGSPTAHEIGRGGATSCCFDL